jgi:class 3 adenylate cyclase
VTVLFSDIVGFTRLSSRVATEELFGMLNGLYTAFDALVDTHGVHKVDTIGDGEEGGGGRGRTGQVGCP